MTEEQELTDFAARISGTPARRNDDAFIVELAETLHEAIQQARARGDETAQRCAGKNLTETLINVTEWFDVAGDDGDGVFV